MAKHEIESELRTPELLPITGKLLTKEYLIKNSVKTCTLSQEFENKPKLPIINKTM